MHLPRLRTPASGSGKATKGQVGHREEQGKVTFDVSGNGKRLAKFVIPEVGAYCYTGYEAITVAVPNAKIHNGHVNEAYVIKQNPPDAKPTVLLTGDFKSPSTFKGQVKGKHYCDYDIEFTSDHPK